MFDIIIKNGLIVDGTGSSSYRADIAIKDGVISAIGAIDAQAEKIIDASNLVVSPGFIDIHTHSDITIQVDPRAESQIRQGVTTQVVGSCGYGMAPCTDESRVAFAKARSILPIKETWNSFDEYLNAVQLANPATNIAALVGHGTIRSLAMGSRSSQAADFDEIEKISILLEESLQQGAFGMSTGLEYFPGKAAQLIELEKLCEVIGKYNASHASHVRNRDMYALSGFLEVIEVARNTNSHLQISHVNPKFGRPDSTMQTLLSIINTARQDGCRIDLDVMPTNYNHTGPKNLLPVWAHALTLPQLLEQLDSKEGRAKLAQNPTPMWQLSVQNRWERVYLFNSVKTSRYLGRSIASIAEELSCSGWDALCRLMLEEGDTLGGMKLVGDSFYDEDIISALSDPFCSASSDATACAIDGVLADFYPSPNTYIWAESFIRKYAREDKVLSLEEAIYKLTALPASQINLTDRGKIQENYCADIVIFNYEELNDEASLTKPNVYPQGIDYVIVNGKIAMQDNITSSKGYGKVLRRK